jgi:hypothetical protein
MGNTMATEPLNIISKPYWVHCSEADWHRMTDDERIAAIKDFRPRMRTPIPVPPPPPP